MRKGEKERENESLFGGKKSDTGSVHEGACPEVPPMDARPGSPPSHRVGAPDPGPRVRDAALLDPRPQQFHLFLCAHPLIFHQIT